MSLMGKNYKTEGIIIKRINYREADRIVTVLTKDYGKIIAIAKGVRRIDSKRKGMLELFNRNLICFARSKNIDVITEVESIESFFRKNIGLEKLTRVYYLAEIIDRLTAEKVEEKKIFDIFVEFLRLCKGDKIGEIDVKLNGYLRQILLILGFIDVKRVKFDFDAENYIEQIIERKIKTKRIMNL